MGVVNQGLNGTKPTGFPMTWIFCGHPAAAIGIGYQFGDKGSCSDSGTDAFLRLIS